MHLLQFKQKGYTLQPKRYLCSHPIDRMGNILQILCQYMSGAIKQLYFCIRMIVVPVITLQSRKLEIILLDFVQYRSTDKNSFLSQICLLDNTNGRVLR